MNVDFLLTCHMYYEKVDHYNYFIFKHKGKFYAYEYYFDNLQSDYIIELANSTEKNEYFDNVHSLRKKINLSIAFCIKLKERIHGEYPEILL